MSTEIQIPTTRRHGICGFAKKRSYTMASTDNEDKLYDREDQIQQLLSAYDRCCVCPSNTCEIVTIVGPSGAGKTALASHLKNRVTQDGGYFVGGKFDQPSADFQTNRDYYSPFVTALSALCCQLVFAGEDRVTSFKTALAVVLSGAEISVLQESIPSLGSIYGTQNNVATLSGRVLTRGLDAETRFVHIVCMLVYAAASERPVVLFLDDIQWASAESMKLLQSLASNNHHPFVLSRLILLCTYRNDEFASDTLLSKVFNEKKEARMVITSISVPSISKKGVKEMILDRLALVSVTKSTTLAGIIHYKTNGNVLFASLLINFLIHDQVVAYDGSGEWHWDDNQIIQEIEAKSVLQLLVKIIDQVPPNVKELLKVASCLGTTFTETMLWSAANLRRSDIACSLQIMKEKGLVVQAAASGKVRFAHDKMQEAAYSLISEADQAAFHLGVGQRLLHWLPGDQQDDYLMLIVDQISRGIHLVDDSEEKLAYAVLYLRAGQKAATASEFSTSSAFLRIGISLLGKRRWKDHYSVCLRLYNVLAEIEYYSGNQDQVDVTVGEIIKRSHSLNDALIAHFTRIYSMGTRGEMDAALDEGLAVLAKLGEVIPGHPGVVCVVRSFMRCQSLLRGKSDSDILSLPLMHDKTKLAAVRMLNVLSAFAFYVRVDLIPVLTCCVIKSTLKHGMSDMSCVGFATLSILNAIRGEVEKADRLGNLALKVFKKQQATEWEAWVAFSVYAGIYPLKHPFRDSLEPLLSGHRSGLVLGDIHLSMTCAMIYVGLSNCCGVPLQGLANEIQSFRDLCRRYHINTVLSTLDAMLQLIFNFMGKSNDPLILTGDILNEDDAIQVAARTNPVTHRQLLFYKHWLAVYFNDLPRTQELSRQIERLKMRNLLPFISIHYKWLDGLAAARLSRSCRQQKKKARCILSQLQEHAVLCPQNYSHKAFLIEAELLSSEGSHQEAMIKYQISIEQAKQHNMIHEEGLACEGAGHALREYGRLEEANEQFCQARACYLRWGSQAKVDQLDALM